MDLLRRCPAHCPSTCTFHLSWLRLPQPVTTRSMKIPSQHVGRVIGKNGQTIRQIQELSGAQIDLPKESRPGEDFRVLTVTGTEPEVNYCCQLLQIKITPREEGGAAGPGPNFSVGGPGVDGSFFSILSLFAIDFNCCACHLLSLLPPQMRQRLLRLAALPLCASTSPPIKWAASLVAVALTSANYRCDSKSVFPSVACN